MQTPTNMFTWTSKPQNKQLVVTANKRKRAGRVIARAEKLPLREFYLPSLKNICIFK